MFDAPDQGGRVGGWALVAIGLMITAVGLIWALAPQVLRLGRLPGDIVIEGKNGRFSFDVMTCVVISILLSLILWIVRVLTR